MAKRCSACRETLPLDRFGKDRARKDGYRHDCSDCKRARDRCYRDTEKGLEVTRRQRTLWRRKHPETSRAMMRRYYLAHKQEAAAMTAVQHAIRVGKLVREPCEVCGSEPAEAHHPDYDKPLDVRFLCRKHHKRHHRDLRDKLRNTRPRSSSGLVPSPSPATRGRTLLED